ncbi:MAG: RDD family protein [Burkholderiales bacterium]
MRSGSDGSAAGAANSASVARRGLSLCYEALLLLALLLAGALPFVLVAGAVDRIAARPLFQLYLVALSALYFVWQWRHGGQTLAMKTWRIRVVTREGAPLDWPRAARRYLFALCGTLLLGAGFLWALVDRERLFLHNRLAGTKIIMNDE